MNKWLEDNYNEQYFQVAKAAMQGLLSQCRSNIPEMLVNCAFDEADKFMVELSERLKGKSWIGK